MRVITSFELRPEDDKWAYPNPRRKYLLGSSVALFNLIDPMFHVVDGTLNCRSSCPMTPFLREHLEKLKGEDVEVVFCNRICKVDPNDIDIYPDLVERHAFKSIISNNGESMNDFPRPLWDRVVINPVKVEEVSPGGLFIPEVARGDPCRGEVMAVGPGVYTGKGRLIEAGVEVGDVVLYSKRPISAVEYEGYLIMRSIDLLGVFKDGGQ